MIEALAGAGWLLSLAVALVAAEVLVSALTRIGADLRLSAGLVGLLVALGADGPEVTSALISVVSGSGEVGLGVVLGSNVYNLAGLLGLSAVLAGGLATGRRTISPDAGTAALLTVLLACLVLMTTWHVVVAIVMLLGLAGYASYEAVVSAGTGDAQAANDKPLSARRDVSIALGSAVFIIAGSEGLVQSSLYLGPRLGVSTGVMGTLVLAIATSLPNTWAAISLARRGMAAEAISATFNSNSINAAIGAGVPALFVLPHVSTASRTVDIGWLLGMTVVTVGLVSFRRTFARTEGMLLLGLYAVFLVVRLVTFG